MKQQNMFLKKVLSFGEIQQVKARSGGGKHLTHGTCCYLAWCSALRGEAVDDIQADGLGVGVI